MKKTSRKKKTLYSIVFLGMYQIIVFICNLIVPKLILAKYGSEYNGICSSITQFLNLVAILRIGVAGATRVELYKAFVYKDSDKVNRIVKATDIFMRKISIIFLILLLLFAVVYPIVLDTQYSFINVSSLVLIIGLGTFSQYFFGLTYQTLLQADQKLYIYNIIQIIANLLNALCVCLLIKYNYSIHMVKLISIIIFSLSPIVLNLLISYIYKINKNVEPDNTALEKKNDVVAHSIANIIHENTDVVVLTLFTSVKIVSVYTVYYFVSNGIKQIFEIFTSSMESIFGDLWVKQEMKQFEDGLKLFEFIIGVLVSIVFSCAIILIIPFVKLYTSGVTDINYILPLYAILVLIAQMFYCFRIPYVTIVQAAGKYKETKTGAYLEAAINIVISCVFCKIIGIYGVVIGTLCANVFRTIQYEFFSSKYLLRKKNYNSLFNIVWSIFNIFVCFLGYKFFEYSFLININSWFLWITVAFIVFIFALIETIISSLIFYPKNVINIFKIIKKKNNVI